MGEQKDKGIVIELHPAVAELNEVRDFDPASLLQPLQDDPGYTIPVSGKLTWFRLVYPKGKVSIEVVSSTPERAEVTAYLYADCTDPEDAYLASNTGSCERNMENKFILDRHLEVAASRAIARALEVAGFGCQYSSFNGFAEEGGTPSSTPAGAGSGRSKALKPGIKQVEDNPDANKKIEGKNKAPATDPKSAGTDGADEGTDKVAEWKAHLSFDDAKEVITVHNTGVNKGKTLGELCVSNIRAVQFVANKYTGSNYKAIAAAQILLEAGAKAAASEQGANGNAA